MQEEASPSSAIGRWSKRYQEVKLRDERWLMRLNIRSVERILYVLLASFILLNFVDILTTLTAMSSFSTFSELNPIASGLFNLKFSGFMAALVLKYFPLAPITYGVFIAESGHNPVQVRAVKLGTLSVLGAADVFYLAVAVNNIANLALAFHW